MHYTHCAFANLALVFFFPPFFLLSTTTMTTIFFFIVFFAVPFPFPFLGCFPRGRAEGSPVAAARPEPARERPVRARAVPR